MTARPIEHPVAEVLRVLAVSRSSGALEVRGQHSGTFFLQDGDITYAEALGLPLAEEFDAADPGLPSTIQSSIVEVGLTLLVEGNAEGERPLFRPGRRHWSGLAIRLEVESMLAEIAQRIDSFTKLGIGPDDDVQLCRLSPGRLAVLSRPQWALAAEMSGVQTVRSLARRSGRPLVDTIETIASLVTAGLVERGSSATVRAPVEPVSRPAPTTDRSVPDQLAPDRLTRESPAREGPARESPARESPPRESGPESPLPQRVRGATPMPTTAPLAIPSAATRPRRPSPGPEQDDSRALALRLLEGLRRL